MYDPNKPACIELLPIETRETDTSISDYKRYPDEWTSIALDTSALEAMQEALLEVGDGSMFRMTGRNNSASTPKVAVPSRPPAMPPATSRSRAGAMHDQLPPSAAAAGLVILDTPGLNAIGADRN